jgi:hypothetical protein
MNCGGHNAGGWSSYTPARFEMSSVRLDRYRTSLPCLEGGVFNMTRIRPLIRRHPVFQKEPSGIRDDSNECLDRHNSFIPPSACWPRFIMARSRAHLKIHLEWVYSRLSIPMLVNNCVMTNTRRNRNTRVIQVRLGFPLLPSFTSFPGVASDRGAGTRFSPTCSGHRGWGCTSRAATNRDAERHSGNIYKRRIGERADRCRYLGCCLGGVCDVGDMEDRRVT